MNDSDISTLLAQASDLMRLALVNLDKRGSTKGQRRNDAEYFFDSAMYESLEEIEVLKKAVNAQIKAKINPPAKEKGVS